MRCKLRRRLAGEGASEEGEEVVVGRRKSQVLHQKRLQPQTFARPDLICTHFQLNPTNLATRFAISSRSVLCSLNFFFFHI